MKIASLIDAVEISSRRKRKRRWHKIVSVLVAIVVFCTTYALILPAITLEEDAICGQTEHTHNESCYTNADELSCQLPEHIHIDSCYPVNNTVESETPTDIALEDMIGVKNNTSAEDSVSGVEANASDSRAVTAYTTVNLNSLDSTGNTRYIVYTELNGNYYAVNGNGGIEQITVNSDGTITGNINNNILWTFKQDGAIGTYIIKNVGTNRHMHSFSNSSGQNIVTGGAYSSSLIPKSNLLDTTFCVKSNSDYSRIYMNWNTPTVAVTQDVNSAAQFRIASLPNAYSVWFDGTNGDIMGLHGSPNTMQTVYANNNVITLPYTWQSPTKYAYKLNGWYDIVSGKYYNPGATVAITQNTVFYADWVAQTYDVGFNNENTVKSLDTNSFIKTYVFDYNSLFNVQSLSHKGTVSSNGHSEQWTLHDNGLVPYNKENTLNFIFIDWDTDGQHISYPSGLNTQNSNRSVITPDIIESTYNASGGKDLLKLLFDPDTPVIGKHYVGEGNYLYQYMDSTTPNYDGHNGYYYFHSRLNAASYNQSQQRFYLYDYLERTSDSRKDGGAGEYSDFLPFNSPYANLNGQQLRTYYDEKGNLGYEYDAKDGEHSFKDYNSLDNVGSNYWFGFRSDIEFFLPNDSGDTDEYGNYGNISTKGEHMIFEFHGDDDLWIFVDGELMLDVGGVHGIEYGKIDFSTGTVTTNEGDEAVVQTFEEILGPGRNVKEGTHTLSVAYMERGSSQSNACIYFNIAPRYDLQITKEDIFTATELNGAQFTVYTDENCTKPAQLWTSQQAYFDDIADDVVNDSISTFEVVDGIAKCWGISAGKTYYIKETKSPEGYPIIDDIMRITLNNRGFATIETTVLNGSDGKPKDGFAVIEQDINDTLKLVALLFTNQKEGETTKVRVQKEWDKTSVNLPDSIKVYLTVDGRRVGRTATLNESNGWSYTWTGLPKYEDDGVTEIKYQVEEALVSGYVSSQSEPVTVVNHKEWVKTDAMSDSTTYLLVNANRALSFNGTSFSWLDTETAKNNPAAQWMVETNAEGFRLTNKNNYSITYNRNNNNFTAVQSKDTINNQVLYFTNSRLYTHDHDVYYQFGDSGTALSEDGLAFTLYKYEEITGTLVNILNTPVKAENQTALEVNKVWADNKDHSNDSVTMQLYADGKSTGQEIVLNKDNNWSGKFTGLPYYQADDKTPVVYTVEEKHFSGYTPTYSEITEKAGPMIDIWKNADTLSAAGNFRFVSSGYALATNSNGSLISKVTDATDVYQQWQAVAFGNGYKLKNVGSGSYLYNYGSTLTTTTNINYASTVTLSNGVLKVNSRYIELSSKGVSSTRYSNNGTVFSVSHLTQTEGKPIYSVTVTNTVAKHILPETGSTGVAPYILGGLFIIILIYVYMYKAGRERL